MDNVACIKGLLCADECFCQYTNIYDPYGAIQASLYRNRGHICNPYIEIRVIYAFIIYCNPYIWKKVPLSLQPCGRVHS